MFYRTTKETMACEIPWIIGIWANPVLPWYDPVDGQNPAPVDIVNIPWFTRLYTSQVVQDFSHQPYHLRLKHLISKHFSGWNVRNSGRQRLVPFPVAKAWAIEESNVPGTHVVVPGLQRRKRLSYSKSIGATVFEPVFKTVVLIMG